MPTLETIGDATDALLSRTFGDGPVRETNMKLTRNVSMFASAVILFKLYGHLFEV